MKEGVKQFGSNRTSFAFSTLQLPGFSRLYLETQALSGHIRVPLHLPSLLGLDLSDLRQMTSHSCLSFWLFFNEVDNSLAS